MSVATTTDGMTRRPSCLERPRRVTAILGAVLLAATLLVVAAPAPAALGATPASGAAVEWGGNFRRVAVAPVQVPTLTSGVRAVAAALDKSYAITDEGSVLTWTAGVGPHPVSAALSSGVTAISASAGHVLAVKDGKVLAWGENLHGQLGNGKADQLASTDPLFQHGPAEVPGLSGVTAVAARGNHSLALKADGTVWAWGENSSGELGDGTTVDRPQPTQVAGLAGVVAIATGGASQRDRGQVPSRPGFSLALLADGGKVMAWGDNSTGQLGVGVPDPDPTVPVPDRALVPVAVPGLGGVTAIAAGNAFALAVGAGGSVAAWGENTFGQLGDGTTTDRSSPVVVPDLAGVTTVSAGRWHSLALRANGSVAAWGSNDGGQLGDGKRPGPQPGEEPYRSSPDPVDTLGVGVSAVAAEAEGSRSLAVQSGAVPGPPVGVTAVAGFGEVTVSWSPPLNPGGSPLGSYTVSGSPGGSVTAFGDATEAVVTGLTNGDSYTFTVTASNATGVGPPSAPSPSVRPGTAVVTGVSPSRGPTGGGTVVTVDGSGFTGALGVSFGAVPASSFQVVSDTEVKAVSPARAAGDVHVVVVGVTAKSAAVVGDLFTYTDTLPTVTGVSPSVGSNRGGATVTITGTGFVGATAVRFGDVTVTSYRVDSDTGITAVSPAAPNGKVDVTVTTPQGTSALVDTDRFTAVDGVWSATAPPHVARDGATATLLTDPGCGAECGHVLVTGGNPLTGPSEATTEIYDPAVGTWRVAAPMSVARVDHTATLLADGRVLVAGGKSKSISGRADDDWLSAEIFDPAAGTWTPTGSMSRPRSQHTATRLTKGRVLVTGGYASDGHEQIGIAETEIFNPDTGLWTGAGTMITPRLDGQTASLVAGKVLVAGGKVRQCPGNSNPCLSTTAAAELYDPDQNAWVSTGRMIEARQSHTATSLPPDRPAPAGRGVLVAGGVSTIGEDHLVGSAEIYDPTLTGTDVYSVSVQGAWKLTGPMNLARSDSTAALLGDGRVLVAGGHPRISADNGQAPEAPEEIYDPGDGRWSVTTPMATPHLAPALVALPDGRALAVSNNAVPVEHGSTEVFDPAPAGPKPWLGGVTPSTGSTAGGRSVVIRGSGLFPATAVRFGGVPAVRIGPGSDTEVTVIVPPQAQGVVEVTVTTPRGTSPPVSYRYGGGAWAKAKPLSVARYLHTATLLDPPACHGTALPPRFYPCGKVLVAGGTADFNGAPGLRSAVLYDPAAGTWQRVPPMGIPRFDYTATLLEDGRVLVVGGRTNDQSAPPLASAEIFDPAADGGTGAWRFTGSMSVRRLSHTATLLDGPSCRAASPPSWCGQVLVAGGAPGDDPGRYSPYAKSELFNPGTGTWSEAAPLLGARTNHTVSLLPDGRLLAAGGLAGVERVPLQLGADGLPTRAGIPLASAEIYDPAGTTPGPGGTVLPGIWRRTGDLSVKRFAHTATVVDQAPCGAYCGKVLVVGGIQSGIGADSVFLASAEVFDPAAGGGIGGWTTAGVPGTARGGHTATLLGDGKVLVEGRDVPYPQSPGLGVSSAELFDPVTGGWSDTAGMGSARGLATATRLDGPGCRDITPPPRWCGKVLVAGGATTGGVSSAPPPLAGVELYTPAPVVSVVTPGAGPVGGASKVTFTGSGFSSATAVSIGGVAASGFTVESPTRITAVSPAHAKGPVEVAVVNDGGTSARLVADATGPRFRFLDRPGQVTDLAAAAVSDTDVDLSFTTADDGSGMVPATDYVVMQSSVPIVDQATFDAALSLCGGPCRTSLASTVSLRVGQLNPGTTYYYAVQAVNEIAQVGAVSNQASVTTTGKAATTGHATTTPDSQATTTIPGGLVATGGPVQTGGQATTTTQPAGRGPTAIPARSVPRRQAAPRRPVSAPVAAPVRSASPPSSIPTVVEVTPLPAGTSRPSPSSADGTSMAAPAPGRDSPASRPVNLLVWATGLVLFGGLGLGSWLNRRRGSTNAWPIRNPFGPRTPNQDTW